MTGLLFRDAEVGCRTYDVAVDEGQVVAVGSNLAPPSPSSTVIDAAGDALLPGLHDHHLHLLALAARSSSVRLGPPEVRSAADLDRVIRSADGAAPPGSWMRGVDHDSSIGGPLDRARLDALAPGRPVRVQHRSGACWTLNSAGLAALPLGSAPDGVELDGDGAPTGRLWRLDRWLHDHLPTYGTSDLGAVGRKLVARGVTGVTDATPFADPTDYEVLANAVRSDALPCKVVVTGGIGLAGVAVPTPLRPGPVKVIIADHQDPDVESLTADIARAHATGRPVAVHCVTAAAIAIALAAWDGARPMPGDRVEHGSIIAPGAVGRLADLGITVVTQPAFVHDHGDRYLAEVETSDRPDLYRCRSLLDGGVAVGGSTDAPYGDADPWQAIATAMDRRTASGRPVGAGEALPGNRALDLFLSPLEAAGGPPRSVRPGAPADLCLLDRPLASALADPTDVAVRTTVVEGRCVHWGG